MKTLAAALLLALAKKEINEQNLKDIFTAAGAKANEEEIKKVVEACKGKDADALVKEGRTKLGGMTAGASSEHHDEAKKDDKKGKDDKKKKEKEKPKEEEEEDMGFGGLF